MLKIEKKKTMIFVGGLVTPVAIGFHEKSQTGHRSLDGVVLS